MSDMLNVWLIEYVGAIPCPVYAPTKPGFPTANPWEAKCFDTKEEAEAWMKQPYDSPEVNPIPYSAPWTAIQHSFNLPECPEPGGVFRSVAWPTPFAIAGTCPTCGQSRPVFTNGPATDNTGRWPNGTIITFGEVKNG